MTVPEMREYLKRQYPGVNWRRKVNNMPKEQVIAIYKSMMNRKKKPQKVVSEGKQLTIFDFLK